MHNLINSPPIAGAWKEHNSVTVHGVLFRIETGLLEVRPPLNRQSICVIQRQGLL